MYTMFTMFTCSSRDFDGGVNKVHVKQRSIFYRFALAVVRTVILRYGIYIIKH